MTTFEIPLIASPQSFVLALGDQSFVIRVIWNEKAACWVMDLSDLNGNQILVGVPLVTGADLLGQFEYLGFGGQMVVRTDHNPDAVPTFTNLGDTGHVYFIKP